MTELTPLPTLFDNTVESVLRQFGVWNQGAGAQVVNGCEAMAKFIVQLRQDNLRMAIALDLRSKPHA